MVLEVFAFSWCPVLADFCYTPPRLPFPIKGGGMWERSPGSDVVTCSGTRDVHRCFPLWLLPGTSPGAIISLQETLGLFQYRIVDSP